MVALSGLLFCAGLKVYGQVLVSLNNDDARIFEIDGTTPVSGSAYAAQLFLRNGSLTPLSPSTVFRTGMASGFVVPVDVTVPGASPGGSVELELRVWPTAYGSYDSAAAIPGARIGRTPPLTVFIPINGMPGTLSELTSFNLKPVEEARVVFFPGYNAFTNPFERESYDVSSLFAGVPNLPIGTAIHKWNRATSQFQTILFDDLQGWNPGIMLLLPGEGAFLNNPGATFTNIFRGTRRTSIQAIGGSGYIFASCQVVTNCGFEGAVGVPPKPRDIVYQYAAPFFSPDYFGSAPSSIHRYTLTGWDSEPMFEATRAAFFYLAPPPLVVTNTSATGAGSLANAINMANSQPGLDYIHFNIAGTGPRTIRPLAPLPPIMDNVVIDGYTQPGAVSGTPGFEINASLLIELDGSLATNGVNGLDIRASNCVVRGLVINRFANGSGILVQQGGSNIITGNFIGTDTTGLQSRPNRHGINILNAGNNVVGGLTPAEVNLISGNSDSGITIEGAFAFNNAVQGNYIGLDRTGEVALGNLEKGVSLGPFARNNRVGGAAPGARNMISGNKNNVEIGANCSENRIEGNYIGTTSTGSSAPTASTQLNGVLIGAASDNRIGGNVISAHENYGVFLNGSGSGNRVQGNFIGVDANGTAALPNRANGVYLINSTGANIVGTDLDTVGDESEGNVISGSAEQGHGVHIFNCADGQLIAGNLIGTDQAGTARIPNVDGIRIENSSRNVLIRNVVSGNDHYGVYLGNSSGNRISGNFIGATRSGSRLENGYTGIYIQAGSGNLIGGVNAGEGNVIAFNLENGVGLAPLSGTGNAIQGNSFFGNNLLAIDLGVDGASANDEEGDLDEGPNRRQNMPNMLEAVFGGGTLSVKFYVDSLPANARYPLQVEFVSQRAIQNAPQTFLARVNYPEAGARLVQTLFLPLPEGILPGDLILATATDADGNTSEFSSPRIITSLSAGSPPSVRLHPESQAVELNGIVILESGAISDIEVFYQWQLNGASIPNATNRILEIKNAGLCDAGKYTVLVYNRNGVAKSAEALVTPRIDSSAVLANDFPASEGVASLSGTATGSNTNATAQRGEPLHAGKKGGRSMWLRWTPPASGVATISTCGSSFDTLLAVYRGSLGSLTNIASNDDRDLSYTSQVVFNARANVAYEIAVDGLHGASGNIVLHWSVQAEPVLFPEIVAQPKSVGTQLGSLALFRVIVSNATPEPLQFEWFHNGSTNALFTTNGPAQSGLIASELPVLATMPNVGSYRVRVRNSKWSALSEVALLQISSTNGLILYDKEEDAADGIHLVLGAAALSAARTGPAGGSLVRFGSITAGSDFAATQSSEPKGCPLPDDATRWLNIDVHGGGLLVVDTAGNSIPCSIALYKTNIGLPEIPIARCAPPGDYRTNVVFWRLDPAEMNARFQLRVALKSLGTANLLAPTNVTVFYAYLPPSVAAAVDLSWIPSISPVPAFRVVTQQSGSGGLAIAYSLGGATAGWSLPQSNVQLPGVLEIFWLDETQPSIPLGNWRTRSRFFQWQLPQPGGSP
jgi:parallel beta-helix repeat protein